MSECHSGIIAVDCPDYPYLCVGSLYQVLNPRGVGYNYLTANGGVAWAQQALEHGEMIMLLGFFQEAKRIPLPHYTGGYLYQMATYPVVLWNEQRIILVTDPTTIHVDIGIATP